VKTCAIDYSPNAAIKLPSKKKVFKIPIRGTGATIAAQRRSDDPDGAGAARQSVAVEQVLFWIGAKAVPVGSLRIIRAGISQF
jgi:hypothetical protein